MILEKISHKKALQTIMDDRKSLVNQILRNLEKGSLWPPGSDTARFSSSPYNPVSDNFYTSSNRIRLMLAAMERGYQDPRWCTLHQAEASGWSPKPGTKGLLLEKWDFTEIRNVHDAQGRWERTITKLDKPKPNFFYVYNAEQLYGVPPLEPKETSLNLQSTMGTLLSSSECPIKREICAKGSYSFELDEIKVPDSFDLKTKSLEVFLSVLSHEMALSTGHPSRLNRPLADKAGTPDYALEELRAELGAAFFKGNLNLPLIPEAPQSHMDYSSSWIKALQNDPSEFFRACRDAEKISDRLYQNYSKTLEAETMLNKAAEDKYRADMEKFGYKQIETTDPDGDILFQNQITKKISSFSHWGEVAWEIERLQIAADLTANNFHPTADLVDGIHHLWFEAGKELTLREIADMAKDMAKASPEGTLAEELIRSIQAECCQQEMAMQAMNEIALEAM